MKIAGFLCIALAGITTVVDHVTAKKAGYIDAPLKACPREIAMGLKFTGVQLGTMANMLLRTHIFFLKEQLPKKGDPFSNDRNDLYHRYGWQTCILWLNNPANKDPKILGVSLSFSKTFENHRDPERFKVDGTAVKVRYVGHLSNDRYSGEYGLEFIDEVGGFQDLILWHQLTEEARCALNLMDWGNGGEMPINDDNFWTSLRKAYPF
ncbi:unnamed protein product [Peronospora farinosa]|uniref:Uncharacterized protein n=1 Tax=Peronospora farinosa TaxID=134698 RepID=A0ABN8CC55_9STRA|nr:unnamed protein product [Peronospora farinosa]